MGLTAKGVAASPARRRLERRSGRSRVRKVSPKNFDIKFDTESYLHEDRIREMINMEHLEQTLDEVLTISTDDMDDMLKSPGLSSHSSGRKLAVLQHGHCDVFLSILSFPPVNAEND